MSDWADVFDGLGFVSHPADDTLPDAAQLWDSLLNDSDADLSVDVDELLADLLDSIDVVAAAGTEPPDDLFMPRGGRGRSEPTPPFDDIDESDNRPAPDEPDEPSIVADSERWNDVNVSDDDAGLPGIDQLEFAPSDEPSVLLDDDTAPDEQPLLDDEQY